MSWGASSRWTWVQVFGFQFWVPVFGYQIMSWIPVFVWFCVGEDARTCPCQRLFWHLCRWNYQISNKNDQTTIKGMFWTVVCFFSVWLMLFLVLHWHRWWSLWLWKSCRGWIAGFRGRRISTLGHWSFASSEAPIWMSSKWRNVTRNSSMTWRNLSIYLYRWFWVHSFLHHNSLGVLILVRF